MEWSWLRDWWHMAKFRRGDRTNPATQRHRRRGSGNAVAPAFTDNTAPGDTDGNTEQPVGEGEPNQPVRFFVDRHDYSEDDGDDEEQLVEDDEDDPDRVLLSDTELDQQAYSDTEAMYDHLYCDCEKSLRMNGDLDPTDGLDSDDSSTSGKQVVVAVCAMSKKSQSKPMKEILTRLQEFEFIRMVVIGEEIILNEPVDRWPLCDCLISFHSKGFPLEKAIQYAQLRQPYVINNLHMQFDIQDRRRVYAILEKEGIEIPRYAVLDRDSPDPKQHELVESEDHVEVNGIVFNKPFVEKPVSAEDHNIYIYYPTSAGGGSQRLFRKIGSRSSVYSPESRVRKTGSFIYEDFMPTDGTDVKVYTVGPDYAHAEARKSPALDGKVERDSDGKEIRYPVILSNAEKLISRKVCLAFKQTVCGFDLLRANGKSFVCDVNGFSFVKNSNKYYDDCAKILGNMILRELAPQLHIPWSVPFQLDDPPIVPTTFGKMMELRCVTAVIRHGDRTPKQKMKVEVRHQKFFEIFEKYDGYRYGHIKLKRPKQLQEILDIARSLLAEIQTKAADSEIEEKQSKLEQLKSVLEMYGHFSGINRKVQMKYQPKGRPRGSSSDDGKHDCSNFVFVSDAPKDPSLVLILKWGGELTPAGRIQAEELGRIFRCMYPGGQSRQPGVGEGPGAQGLGLLRLHSTFRHDLKIYASDEGRVQMTAAAFAKGLLALEGELTPILVQMVKSANTNGLLDNDCDSSKYQNMAKSRLHELMQIDREFTAEDRAAINPGNAISINQAMNFVKNPVQCCAQVHSLIRSLMAVVAVKRDDPKTRDAVLYHGETWELMGRRWGKIEKDFCTKNKNYDISKIPDIYDCIKYDLQHNQHTLQFDLAEELYISAKYLADIVIPQEYGLTMHEKLTIGQGICTPLLKKIRADLQRNIEELGGEESVNRLNPRYSHGVSSPGRHVRTRLYFTSESHVHSLLTVLRHGGLLNVLTDEQWRRAMEYVSMVSELNYMSQIVIMLYEDPMKDPSSEERFHVELHFSPGVNCCVQKNLPPGPGFRPHSRNDSVTSKNASGDEDTTSRIEEENDTEEENSFSHNSSLHHTPSKSLARTDTDIDNIVAGAGSAVVMKERRMKKIKSSSPIPIGSCHTVSGHEAMDLAKRLSEELAVQQQQQQQQHQQQHHLTGSFGCGTSKDIARPLSPDSEPRARSFEHQQQHHHSHQHHHHHGKMHHHRSKGKGVLNTNASRGSAERCRAKDLHEADIWKYNIMQARCITGVQKHAGLPYRLRDGSSGAGYSSMMATAISTTTTATTMTTTTTVSGAGDAATAADSNDDGANNVTSTGSTITGSCLYCCTGGTTTVPRMAGPGATLSHGSGSLSSCCCCCCCCCSTPSSSAGGLAGTGVGGPAGTSNATTVRRQRHSIAGQMSYFKMLGTFSKKMATSTNSLFSTAVISGSSSAPNLRDMIPSTASPSGFGGVPPIRPLETLHNALSLKQLDAFLERMTIGPLFKTPASSPPPKHPLVTAATGSSALSNVGSGTKSPLSLVSRDSFPEGATMIVQPSSNAPLASGSGGEEKCSGRAGGIRDFAPFASAGQPGAATGSGGISTMPGTGTTSTNGANVAGAQQSWSDHSSSMTSSISALSSGGPSSPNYSEVYSRGCPSSDMSASITSSTDGLAAIVGGGTSEQLVALPQLFAHPQSTAAGARMSPKHPYMELAMVESFGKFGEEDARQQDDQHLVGGGDPVVACASTTDAYLRRSSTMDISGDLTPVSGCSDWESNTNDATKGSTTNYDLTTANTTEEDDEDATISTDTCLSVGDQEQQQLKPSGELNTAPSGGTVPCGSACITNTVPGVFPFDEPLHGRDDSVDGVGRMDIRVRGSRIQRQISLYEKESRTVEAKHTQKAHEWCGEGGTFGSACVVQLGRQHQYPYCQPVQQPLHMSFDELRRVELSRNERSTRYHHEQPVATRATEEPNRGCLAAQTVSQQRAPSSDGQLDVVGSIHTPGALVIREGYIEPPRLTRVTKSFHGKTDHQKLSVELQQGAARSATDAGGLRRASDSPVVESNRYHKGTLRQQHSSTGSSSSQGRFTTSIVQELEQLNTVEEVSASSVKK
ncbi:inositol hexakisphosphate and diphosphoinositol-pentakisphosphate kinase isoform X2 [Anopheles moucheti]|uniref:inositol hexakisphosphate and diphosphoinositol-pentakisphosphate kinase isoform X2 n=1 Tax=Anopheles moucheti TaxID=186751 RepID=UPI0022EFF798|nr:inositol hexakisphosphate and diphosphoinositol-pentakisphosphate kinase isoform X2 [Anopheles moucheti]